MIVVSGGTGFMGSAITRHLLAAGHHVRVMTRSADKAQETSRRWPEARTALPQGRLTFVSADVTKPETLPEAVAGVEAVIQAAQFPGAPIEDPRRGYTYMEVDRNGTLNLLAAVSQAYGARTAGPGLIRFPDGAPRFLYVSGVAVESGSEYFWVEAKWQAEEAIRESGLDFSIVRASWAFGPDDRSLNRLLGYADILPFVPVFGSGREKITPLYVEDLGRLFVRLVAEPDAARDLTLPLGGPQIHTMNEMLRTGLRLKGKPPRLFHIPKPVAKLQGAVLERLQGRVLTRAAVDFITQGGVADLRLLEERFPGFQTTAFVDALETYLGGGPAAR
jgi:uncharacterized protein YbjT (DUF2867 family)